MEMLTFAPTELDTDRGCQRASPANFAVTLVSRLRSRTTDRLPAELTLPDLTSLLGLSEPNGSAQISTVRFLYVVPRWAVNFTSFPYVYTLPLLFSVSVGLARETSTVSLAVLGPWSASPA